MDIRGNGLTSTPMAGDASDWGAATAVPLRLQDRSIGVLTCYTQEAAPLSASDMHLLTTVADQVAVAVENARLYAQAREMATMEERARLARELHDSVTQALFSMTLHTRAAQIMLDQEEHAIRDRFGRPLRELGELTRAALAEMRALIFELRPGALSEEGLAAALRKQAAAVSAREGLRVDVQAPDDRIALDPAGEEHLYRVSQEALHNAVKHAHATDVHIRLWAEDDWVLVEVTDDGVGFDVAAVPPGHLGLRTMAERMVQIGGTVQIVSAPGSGTTVRAACRSRRSPPHSPVPPILRVASSASTSPALDEPVKSDIHQ
jgi:signal transduction histidine kinase